MCNLKKGSTIRLYLFPSSLDFLHAITYYVFLLAPATSASIHTLTFPL